MINLRPTTKLATQIFVALSIITLLSDLFHLPRAYWAAIAATSVLCQTWGESLRKSTQRILATIVGMSIGLLLNVAFEQNIPIGLALILTSIFFMSYFAPVSYLRSIFFASIMLAMIFSISGTFTYEIYGARITETIFGAGVAILTSILVLPTKTGTEFNQALLDYLKKVKQDQQQMFDMLYTGQTTDPKNQIHINREYQQLSQKANTYLYERSLRRSRAVKVKSWMMNLQGVALYQDQLIHTIIGNLNSPLKNVFREELTILTNLINHNIDLAIQHIKKEPHEPMQSLDAFQEKARERFYGALIEPGKQRTELLDFLPIFYFSYKIDSRIKALTDT